MTKTTAHPTSFVTGSPEHLAYEAGAAKLFAARLAYEDEDEAKGAQLFAPAKTGKLTRNYAGSYTTSDGWAIYQSCDDGLWVIVNPETGGRFDSAETLRELRDRYA